MSETPTERIGVLQAVPSALETFAAERLGQHASAICYRMLVSAAPLAIVLVALAGVFLRNEELQADVIDRIVELLPFDEASRAEVQRAVVAIASPASLLGFLGLLAFAWTATGVLAAIRIGLEAALHVRDRRPAVQNKLVDAAGVLGAAVLVVALVVTGAIGDVVRSAIERAADALDLPLPDLGFSLSSRLVQGALVLAVVLVLYRFVPARRLPARALLLGALSSSLLIFGISLASSALYGRATELSVIYGSLTAIFTFLYAVYLSASALLIGAAYAGALADPPPPPGPPLPTQIREGVLGLVRRPRER